MSRMWRREAVRVVVTAIGSDGAALTSCYSDLALGDEGMVRVAVPHGAAEVAITRPVRRRVRLAGHRPVSQRAQLTPRLPGWRDKSDTWMWVRWWMAQRRRHRGMPGLLR